MLHSVSVLRHRKSGTFVLNPFGTFAGHGAYIGIYPYRELQEPTDEQLGDLIIELLKQSGPTGYHIRDIESYNRENSDDETERIRNTFFPENKRRSTSTLARQFAHGEVEFKTGQKSWLVRSRVYDSKDRALKIHEERRVQAKNGASLLGAVVAELLNGVA